MMTPDGLSGSMKRAAGIGERGSGEEKGSREGSLKGTGPWGQNEPVMPVNVSDEGRFREFPNKISSFCPTPERGRNLGSRKENAGA